MLMILHCSIALYGLILFYALTKEELAGNRPLAKFLSIKLIVVFTFYQSFVVRRIFSVHALLSLSCDCLRWVGKSLTC
jgi:organic solute transporter Ostalpha